MNNLSQLCDAVLTVSKDQPHEGHYWLDNAAHYFLLKAAAAFDQSILPELSQEESEFWERLMWFRLFCMGC